MGASRDGGTTAGRTVTRTSVLRCRFGSRIRLRQSAPIGSSGAAAAAMTNDTFAGFMEGHAYGKGPNVRQVEVKKHRLKVREVASEPWADAQADPAHQ